MSGRGTPSKCTATWTLRYIHSRGKFMVLPFSLPSRLSCRVATPGLSMFGGRAREYTRTLNAVKLDKVFAKPFVAALK